MINRDYEVVIGLEVHAELCTETKIFCGCKNAFGAEVNTLCCPVCMGMPGTLPVLNKQANAVLSREPVFLFPELTRRGHQWAGNFDETGSAYRILVRIGEAKA